VKPPRYPLVELLWVDSAQLDGGDWIPRARLDEALADGLAHRSAGYLVADTADAVVLARSITEWQDSLEKLEGVLAIPAAAVFERRVVTRPAP
jgi:lipocalin